ncbi:MAG: hypothetical protein ACKO7P_06160, partial [Bacteroidota bacterium]
MKNLVKFLLFNLVFLVFNSSSFAQADVWFVGNNIKMDFSGGGNPVITNGINVGGDLTESSTAITDKNGNLLFAVVGNKVFDGAQNVALTLPANTWDVAQGSMVIPVPGTTNQYFLTVLEYGPSSSTKPTAKYYRVTVNGTGANNLTISPASNLAPNLMETQTAVPKLNPDGTVSSNFWLLTHEKCNSNHKVFEVSSAGINLSSTQAQGPAMTCNPNYPPKYDDIGTMKFNSCYTQMTQVLGDKIMLYDFDAKTGQLTFKNQIGTIPSAYGAEFSPDGKFLFVLRGQDNNNPGRIFSIPVTSTGLGTPVDMGATGGMRGGHMQLGPDGNIYYAIPEAFGNAGKGKIGRITNPNGGGVLDNNFYTATKAAFGSTAQDQWVNMDMPTFLTSLVVPIPDLLVGGKKFKETVVCAGETVTFEIQVNGTSTVGVQWKASGANSKTQNGGSSFSVNMVNSGITKIE